MTPHRTPTHGVIGSWCARVSIVSSGDNECHKISHVIADAGHESRRLRELMRQDGWRLQIVKRSQRAFKITGLTWIVERTFAWLGRNRRFSKDYEYRVQTSETLLDIAAIRLMLNRLAPAWNFSNALSARRPVLSCPVRWSKRVRSR